MSVPPTVLNSVQANPDARVFCARGPLTSLLLLLPPTFSTSKTRLVSSILPFPCHTPYTTYNDSHSTQDLRCSVHPTVRIWVAQSTICLHHTSLESMIAPWNGRLFRRMCTNTKPQNGLPHGSFSCHALVCRCGMSQYFPRKNENTYMHIQPIFKKQPTPQST